jgi:methylenetetrahydrofolate reductase (NADPH)
MNQITPIIISFEFFPPKTPEGVQRLHETASTLAACHPHFFSVTFGAGGSTREGTLETVEMLKQKTRIQVTPHLASVGCSRADILDMLARYQAMGLRHMLALRGDLPSGMGQAGEIKFASELVALIREVSGDYFRIDVAAYPEIHPQAVSPRDDILNLKRKFDAGANGAITQYFYNPDAYFYYLDECQRLGVNMPIIPGIMPITQFSKLARFSDMCGAEIPCWIRKRLASYGDDTVSIKQFGMEVVYNLCRQLMQGGAPGLHFYTLNKIEGVIDLIDMLGLAPSRAKAHVASHGT